MPERPELSSLVTSLDELTRRVTSLAESESRADTASELFAVERALLGALRRLSRIKVGS